MSVDSADVSNRTKIHLLSAPSQQTVDAMSSAQGTDRQAARLEMRYEPDEGSALACGSCVLWEQAVAVDHSTGEVDQLAVVDP